MKRNYKIFLFSWIIFTIFGSFYFTSALNADEQDYYLRLKKSWTHMQRVYEQLNLHYVEEIDPYPLVQAGINGMLDKLDPYTVFIEEEGERRLKIITTGKYGGLGMEIGLRNKKVTVISPIENSPAKRAGIISGDIIIEIDGEDVSKLSINKVSTRLRGKIGTDVTLLINRLGLENPFELTLTREEIVIEDVGYAGFIEPGVAYVSLAGFTDKAAYELKNAVQNLRKEEEIKSFILDLRGNPGGLLDAAVKVVNLFVDKNELVVYTKGFRNGENRFRTNQIPLLPNVPLVVLVDNGSASASEIVAGALQDLDRAVIMGEPTFGKGLVQKIYTIDKQKDAKIKITTAKYYIPSGRCIQKRDYGQDNKVFIRDSITIKDNGSHVFYTRNKREVYDKGGIYPDINVPCDSINYVLIELIRKNLFFDFAVEYHQKKPVWSGDFVIDDSIIKQFQSFLNRCDFKYDIEGSHEIDKLEKFIKKKKYSNEITDLLSQLKQKLEDEKEKDFQNSRRQIHKILRLELAEKYFDKKGRDKYTLEYDTQVIEAVKVLKDRYSYNDILAAK
ncbi:MAG: S41 family peptidase [Calditrichales bacterium]|nr:S41 family peptidase [Calditrichales bacterium]